MMTLRERRAWGAAGVLLAALALGGCSKRVDGPEVQPVAGASGESNAASTATASAAPQAGSGLNGGLGMTGSFPASSAATGTTTGNATATMGSGNPNLTTGSAYGQRP